MTNKKAITENWIDPDDAPALDADWFREADAEINGRPTARRGRPPLDNSKQLVSLRIDRDVLALLRAEGPGWQTRINEKLREAVGL